MSAEETAGTQPPAAPAERTASERQGQHCSVWLKWVQRPLRQPLLTGGGRQIATRESILLKVQTDSGSGSAIGYGEAAPLPWFGTEPPQQAFATLCRVLKAAAMDAGTTETGTAGETVGVDGEAASVDTSLSLRCCVEILVQLVQMPHSEFDGSPCARWALQCALGQAGLLPEPLADFFNMDCAGTVRCLPLAALLQVPAGLLQPSVYDGDELQSGVVQLFDPLIAAGFCAFKLKIGVHPFDAEAAFVAAAARHLLQRAAVAQKPLKLRLDANGSLSAASLAGWLRLLEPLARVIDFIEQPFAAGAEQAAAAAFANSPLALALDESLTTLPQLEKIAEQFPEVVLVVKPSLLGDLGGYLRWRTNPSNCQRKVIYSTALETGIGIHHALAVAAVDPAPMQPVGFGTGSLFFQDGLGCPPAQAAPSAQCEPPAPAASGAAWIGLLSRSQMEAIWKQA